MKHTDLFKAIKDIAYRYVKTATEGDVYSIWNSNEIKYSAFNIALDSIEVEDTNLSYNVVMYYGDRLINNDSNFNFVVADGIRIMSSIINDISDIDSIDIDNNYNITPFQQQFADYLGGVYVRLTITGNNLDLCDIEIEDNGPIIEDLSLAITENGTTKVTAPSNTYYKNVEVDVNVPNKGLEVNFSDIYDSSTINLIASRINEEIAYTKSLEEEWNPDNTTIDHRYYQNDNLVYAPQFDTSNIENANMAYYGCASLQVVPDMDLSNCEDVMYLFNNCKALTDIGLIILPKASNLTGFVNGCPKLRNLRGFKDLGKDLGQNYSQVSLSLSYSPLLTHESLINVINNLYDLNLNGKLGTLTLGTTNLNKLTADEIAIATNKGWTVK